MCFILLLGFVQIPTLSASAMRNIGADIIIKNPSDEHLATARMWMKRSLLFQDAPSTYRLIGTTYQLEGKVNDAVHIWRNAGLVRHAIGVLLTILPTEPSNRVVWEHQVIPLISESEDWVQLGNTYLKLSEYKAAIAAYRKALKKGMTLKTLGEADVSYSIGAIYQYKLNDLDQALKAYEEAKALGSFQNEWNEFNTYLQIASLLLTKDSVTAFQAAQVAVDLKPMNVLAHTVFGLSIYSATGKLDAAERQMDIAAQLNPASLWPWLHRAQLYMYADQYEAAIGAYRHALTIDPDNRLAREMIAYIQQTFLQKDPIP